MTALNINFRITRHASCGKGLASGTAATTEHVAIQAGIAPCAYKRQNGGFSDFFRVLDGNLCVVDDVTDLTTAINGAEYGTASDSDFGFAHVGPGAEHETRITLATTINVVVARTVRNGIKS